MFERGRKADDQRHPVQPALHLSGDGVHLPAQTSVLVLKVEQHPDAGEVDAVGGAGEDEEALLVALGVVAAVRLARHVDVAVTMASGEFLLGHDDPRMQSEHLLDDVMDVALPFGHPLAEEPEIDPRRPGDPDRLPWLRANMVTTVDGAGRSPDGLSAGISNDADRRVFGRLRGLADVVLAGGTSRRSSRCSSRRSPSSTTSARSVRSPDSRSRSSSAGGRMS